MKRPVSLLAAAIVAASFFVLSAPAADFEFVPRAIDSFATHGPAYGTAIFDANGDGRLDLFVSRHKARPDLYLNLGNFRFEVADPSAWPALRDQHGAAALDFDRDGDVDVYVTQGAERGEGVGANQLWVATPGASYELLPAPGFLADLQGRGRGALWLDLHGDASMELLVLNFESPARLFEFTDSGWRDRTQWLPPHGATARKRPRFGVGIACAGDLDGDGVMELFVGGERNLLLGFDPGQGLLDVGSSSGFRVTDRFVNAAAMSDVDGDEDLDLLLATGEGRVRLWRNESADGDLVLRPEPALEDIAGSSPVGLALADLDNDGAVDLLLAHAGRDADPTTEILARNDGHGGFKPVHSWGVEVFGESRGATDLWAVDLDHDGDLDLVNTRGAGPDPGQSPVLVVYENRISAGGIIVELRTDEGAPQGLGAVVELHGADGRRVQEVRAIANRWNCSIPRTHFGLGESKGPYELIVRWTDGLRERHVLPNARGVVRVTRGRSTLEWL